MTELVPIEVPLGLDDYAAYTQLTAQVEALRQTAQEAAPALEGRTVWMVNSTAQGGGVAEMLPRMVALLCELGIQTKWAVVGSDDRRFFDITKRLHNLIHGSGDPHLPPSDAALYERASQKIADELRAHVGPRDVLVVHDPQPVAAGALLKDELGLTAVWRCHIGLDEQTPATEAAWSLLRPWLTRYDATVFSIDAYVPHFLAPAHIIPPAIDPLGHKNRTLSVHKLVGILHNSGLVPHNGTVVPPPFDHQAERLQVGGTLGPATEPDDLGLLERPTVLQVSRWDRLKGFAPLLEGFARLKANRRRSGLSDRHRRRLDVVRLILAGPDPSAIQDDPEGQTVFAELSQRWLELPPDIQRDVALLALPMASRKENALMVNALQRCASIVVQNSLREGFGLTVTEAMWKARPVLGTHAAGLRTQIRDGEDGCLIPDATDPDAIAQCLDAMLEHDKERETWGLNAQRRATEEFLVLAQVRRWLKLLPGCVADA